MHDFAFGFVIIYIYIYIYILTDLRWFLGSGVDEWHGTLRSRAPSQPLTYLWLSSHHQQQQTEPPLTKYDISTTDPNTHFHTLSCRDNRSIQHRSFKIPTRHWKKVHRGYRRHQGDGLTVSTSVCCNPTRQCPIHQGRFNFCHLIRVTLIRDINLIFTPASYMSAGTKKKNKKKKKYIYIYI